MIDSRIIKHIIGHEPKRDGEYPLFYAVGASIRNGEPNIDSIDYREQYFGTYSLPWFDVKVAGTIVSSVAGQAVGEIAYLPEGEAE